MKKYLLAILPVLTMNVITAAPAIASPPSANVTKASGDLVLSIGHGQLVNVPSTISDVFVANENIADVQVRSTRQLYVFGKSTGVTTIYVMNSAGKVVWSANVRIGENIDTVGDMLRSAMPETEIGVSTIGSNTVLLTGMVKTPDTAAEAERLVKAFVGDDINVISRLVTTVPLQVNLKVRIAEVSRSLIREIGTNITTRDTTNGFRFGVSRGRGSVVFGPDGATFVPPTEGSAFNIAGKLAGLDIGAALDLGEQYGLVNMLSEPNLTALSSETGEFLAGGEFPVPVPQGRGDMITIEYRKYGVSLAYTPTVLDSGRIVLRVRAEVSELSSDGEVRMGGFTVPALTIRRAETTVQLGSGQSFMVAGLLRNNIQNSLQKIPGLGDVPLLGAMFRSKAYRKGETELVIAVTPYLVNPIDGEDIRLPTDGYAAASEGEQLLGVETGSNAGGERPVPVIANPAP